MCSISIDILLQTCDPDVTEEAARSLDELINEFLIRYQHGSEENSFAF